MRYELPTKRHLLGAAVGGSRGGPQAGHAVRYATISASRPHVRVGRHELLERQALVALCGPAAEEMIFGWPLPTGVGRGDHANARSYLRPLYADRQVRREIARLRDTAAIMVRQPRCRAQIEAVALALLGHRTLTGDEIKALLELYV